MIEFLSWKVSCLGCPLSMADVIGSAFALLSVWFTVRQSNWCWWQELKAPPVANGRTDVSDRQNVVPPVDGEATS